MNITELRKENEKNGWAAVPESCPQRFLAAICEKRSVSLATNTPIPTPIFRSAPTVTVRRSAGDIAARLAIVGQQLAREARVIAAAQAEEARNADIVRAELFPWERN